MIFYLAAMQNIDRVDLRGSAHRRHFLERARFSIITIPDAEAGDPVHHGHLDDRHAAAVRRGRKLHRRPAGSPANSTLTLSLYIYNLTFRYMPSFGYAATFPTSSSSWWPCSPSCSSMPHGSATDARSKIQPPCCDPPQPVSASSAS